MAEVIDVLSLQDKSGFLFNILHSLTEGVIVADLRGRFLFFNPEAEKILGLGARDVGLAEWAFIYGCYFPDQVTPYLTEQLPLARAIRGEEIRDETIFIKNTARPAGVWISVNGRPLRDEKGTIFGGLVVFRDTTERRKLKNRISTAERLCLALEQTADSIIITDKQATIEYVNPAFEATTGYSKEEAIGQSPRILKSGSHPPEFYQEIWRQIRAGRPFMGTIINRKKSGELYHAQQTITPIKDAEGNITHYVSVLKDITELLKKQELEIEMRLAREVQQRFYRTNASVPGYDIAGAAYPASATGGDYFDFIPMPDGCLCIAIGDVSSHGIGAAMVMAETRAYLRSSVTISSDVGAILTRVNRALGADLDYGHFVTLLLMRLDPHTQTMTYANAGHVPGYLVDGAGKSEMALESTGPPLGPFGEVVFPTSEILPLDPGKIVLFMTDGITDSLAQEDMELGLERAVQYVSAHRNEPAQKIADGLCRAALASAKGGTPQDDTTSVIVKVGPGRITCG
jgi:PAS domain S-box-containing protein